jgi:hypothetical protein
VSEVFNQYSAMPQLNNISGRHLLRLDTVTDRDDPNAIGASPQNILPVGAKVNPPEF